MVLKKWESEVMRGQYIRRVDRELISEEEASYNWLHHQQKLV
jgi:hypothetical protein